MTSHTRRQFLDTCVAIAAAGVARVDAQVQPLPRVYASESSDRRNPGAPVVVGYLVVSDAERHARAVAGIKERLGYRRIIRYNGTDLSKIGCAREMLRYFADADGMRFVAAVVTDPSATARAAALQGYRALNDRASVAPGTLIRLKGWPRRAPASGRQARRLAPYYCQGDIEERVRRDVLARHHCEFASYRRGVRQPQDVLLELNSLLTGVLCRASTLFSGSTVAKASLEAGLRELLDLTSLRKSRGSRWQIIDVAAAAR